MKKRAGYVKLNGKRVFNVFTEPRSAGKKVVIMSHGFRGTSIGPSRTFVDFEKHLIESGVSSLRFDQPNSGNSDGDYIDSSFDEWVKTTCYFAEKYLNEGYEVSLLGQSMGATTTMIAAASENLVDKIPCIILWVPDPKSTFNKDENAIYEEDGQKYKGTFWREARDSDFLGCLDKYQGGIHLVYGEDDKYISKELRRRAIEQVKAKSQPYMVLPGQDHSRWEYDVAQKVYREELEFLKEYFDF